MLGEGDRSDQSFFGSVRVFGGSLRDEESRALYKSGKVKA